MAMNAVRHGTFNGKSETQTLVVRCSSDSLRFYNKVYDEHSINEIEIGRKYWHIPPWVFDETHQHITIWTLIHMSSLDDRRIDFKPIYNKDKQEFITEFIFKEEENESNKNI